MLGAAHQINGVKFWNRETTSKTPASRIVSDHLVQDDNLFPSEQLLSFLLFSSNLPHLSLEISHLVY